MTFTDKQGIKLREKIETALSPFPDDKLKNIFLEYQGIFGANFYNEISGSNDRSKIITLIEKLKNQQKFKYFIDIVSKEYPIIQERYQLYSQLSPQQKAICEEYPVILRSLERLQPDKTSWLKCYAENLRRMKKKPVISNNIQDFKQENELNKLLSKAQQRKLLGIQLENKIILKISCGLPKGTKTFHLFEMILEKGVPLCLWIKSKNQRDSLDDYHYKSIIKELNNLIEVKKILDLNRLHAKIFEIRKKHLAMADSCKKEYLGYHLRILCDCNDRKPINIPAFNQLITNS
jgi:hypothetical protein